MTMTKAARGRPLSLRGRYRVRHLRCFQIGVRTKLEGSSGGATLGGRRRTALELAGQAGSALWRLNSTHASNNDSGLKYFFPLRS